MCLGVAYEAFFASAGARVESNFGKLSLFRRFSILARPLLACEATLQLHASYEPARREGADTSEQEEEPVADLTCSRRRFLGSTSLVAAMAAVPIWHWARQSNSAAMFVSAERAPAFSLGSRAVLLEGPRIARLEKMATTLRNVTGEVILRLDPADEPLLDVAAQQAGVSVMNRVDPVDGIGRRADVVPTRRNFA